MPRHCPITGYPVTLFEGIGLCTYRVIGSTLPRAGEYFLSGPNAQAFLAGKTLHGKHVIVEPLGYAKEVTVAVQIGPLVYHEQTKRILSSQEVMQLAASVGPDLGVRS